MIEQVEQRLGSYCLIQLLGKGEFADVYLGEHLYTDPPLLCDEHPDIPRAVEQVVLKGLSKEPTQRFVDVLSFARALEEASNAVSSLQLLTALPAVTHSEAYLSTESLNTRYQNVPVPLTPLVGRE